MNPKEFCPQALEFMRRIALEGHISHKRLMLVMALNFTMLTDDVPDDIEMCGDGAAKIAFTKLGALDDWLEAEKYKTDKHCWSLASDGASKKRPHGLKHMHIVAMSRWDEEKGTAVVVVLACREIPYEDANTSAIHDKAAGDVMCVRWERCRGQGARIPGERYGQYNSTWAATLSGPERAEHDQQKLRLFVLC